MIDEMIALLGKEQIDDDEKKAYCEKEFDESEDEKKALERAISQLETQIEKNKAAIATLTDDIASLIAGIQALDKQVAEATAQRKEEHAQYIEDLAANNAAKELIQMAENRLNQFYNPKLYVPPPKRDLSEEERITVNMGGTLAPTAAPGGISGTGITAFVQIKAHDAADQLVAPAPPPETWDAYKKRGEEASGVIAMMDHLENDLAKEIAEMETDEKNAQEEYEQLMRDSAAKRAADSQTLAEKEARKADTEAALQKNTEEHKAKTAEAMANAEYIHSLHQECDWLLKYFDARKQARAGEVDSLKRAKAVLSGADYSLAQTGRRYLRRQA